MLEVSIEVGMVIFSLLISSVLGFVLIQQKRLNRELTEEKEKLKNIFENASDGLLILTNGHFSDCNKANLALLGFKEKRDILNLTPAQTSPKYQPDGQESLKKSQEMMRIAREKGSHNFEWVHIKADGSEFWADITLTDISSGDDSVLHVAWRNIQEKKEIKQELESSKQRLEEKVTIQLTEITKHAQMLEEKNKKLEESIENFQIIFDAAMETMVLVDENRNILNINQSGVEMLGYSNKSELINTNAVRYVHKDELEKIQKAFHEKVSGPYELRLLKKDGSELIGLVSARDIEINHKKLRMSTILDLSKIKEKDALISQQSKLAQMGEMVNMIAHQWRQPLNAISAAAIKLNMQDEMGLITSEEIKKTTIFIEDMAQDMSHTINDFMNFTKPTDEKTVIKFQDIIDDIMRLMSAQLKNHNIEFITDIQENLSFVTYKKDLEHVLINLFSNARDAFEEGNLEAKQIEVKAYMKDERCIIKVSDNAGGIKSDVIERIFEPYFTTKEQGKGTGLGLFMSKKMVKEILGGTICVKIVLKV